MNNNINAILSLKKHLQRTIIGQNELIDRLLIAVLTGGHILLEGPPGLAKTTAVKALASGIHASFQRIQFTPDLLPADLTGAEVYHPEKHSFEFVKGPLFNQVVLADEINRAPPKIQSALLEAMQEKQITVNGVTRQLDPLFIVMATQNPLEQGGTYPLPEAQLDRFLLHVVIDYPDIDQELAILQQDRQNFLHQSVKQPEIETSLRISPEQIIEQQAQIARTYIDPQLEKYIVTLVSATRNDLHLPIEMYDLIEYGASPRASIALYKAASAMAYLNQRDYVIPEDIHAVIHDVMRHRIILNYRSLTKKVTVNNIVDVLLNTISAP